MTITIAIIVGVAAMLIGSMGWLLPSPRERQQMQLRQEAMRLGLKIKITDLATVIDQDRAEPTHCIAYGLSRPSSITMNNWQVARERNMNEPRLANSDLPAGWYWSLGDVSSVIIKDYLRVTLPTLNKDILALESTSFNCMIYWREHGEVEQVTQIAQVLKKLIELDN